VIDVAQHHGTPAGCNAAGESLADRDPNALLDLFLDPDRRDCDQLVAELVAEQDGCSVGAEHVPDSRQQLGQEVVQVQVRQRSVSDQLDPSQPFGVTAVAHS
jgi:hypothetical protein